MGESRFTILHTEASMSLGGQEKRILRELEAMHQQGHRLILAANTKSAILKKALEMGFVECIAVDFSFRNFFKNLQQLLAIFTHEKVDISVTHSLKDSWICGIASLLSRLMRHSKTYVIRARHTATPLKSALNRYLPKNPLSDMTIYTSDEITSRSPDQGCKAKVLAVPTGVDPQAITCEERHAARWRAHFGLQRGEVLIGIQSPTQSSRGIEDFLWGARLLLQKEILERPLLPHIHWVVIASQAQLPSLKFLWHKHCLELHQELDKAISLESHLDQKVMHRAAQCARLEERLSFVSEQENPYPLLSSLDLLCLFSTKEGAIPQESIQAAFLGKPLLCRPTKGLQEVCQHGVTGLMIEPGNARSVAQAMEMLSNREKLRKEMGQKARELVKREFTFEATFRKTLSIYSSLC